jgi:hypothetical protein
MGGDRERWVGEEEADGQDTDHTVIYRLGKDRAGSTAEEPAGGTPRYLREQGLYLDIIHQLLHHRKRQIFSVHIRQR